MILVTGSAGYIGSHLCFFLRENNIKFIAIDNLLTGLKKNFNKKYSIICDIGNNKKIKSILIKYKIKTVIHLAALSFPLESEKKKFSYKKNNIDKTLRFINVCHNYGVKNFIFSSSSNVYNDSKVEKSFKEKKKLNQKNYYGYTKYYIEKKLLSKKYLLFSNIIILRLFNIAGYIKKFNFYENKYIFLRLIPRIVYSLKNNKKLSIFYFFNKNRIVYPKRDFLHIEDFLILIKKILGFLNNYKIKDYFNIGSGLSYSVKKIIYHFNINCNLRIDYSLVQMNKKELFYTRANIKKVLKIFNWKPKNSLRDIIKSVIIKYKI
jgi:UDP-glucose 4-epimerase